MTPQEHLDTAETLATEVGEWIAGNGEIPDNHVAMAQVMVQLAQLHVTLATEKRRG